MNIVVCVLWVNESINPNPVYVNWWCTEYKLSLGYEEIYALLNVNYIIIGWFCFFSVCHSASLSFAIFDDAYFFLRCPTELA